MSQTAAPPEPTEIAGRYQVVKKLGAGAFGTVYKAKDKLLGRMVAIKTIRLDSLVASGASAEEMLDRFKREAMVSAQLKHPNIVTIYDIGDAQGTSYLAMEFIDGVGLEKVISQTGRLPLERVALLGAQVADALDFAHQHRVVHRDIKPANIMIEAGDRVKVTDFGIAKVTDSAEHLTMTGSLLGTPSYMSPEQARGSALDGRSDLFSLGCVIYEMLAAQKAFRGDSITGLIFKIITEDPMPIRELDPGVPEEMARIVGKALAKAPEVRYQSGRELHDDLQALMRAGSSPTLRQTDVATAAAPPTILGQTLGGAAPTQVAGKQGVPAPPMAAPTVLSPARPAPPAWPAAPPAPAYGAPPPAVSAPVPQAPLAAPRAAAARRSNTGLLVGLAVGGLVLLLVVGGAAVYLLRRPAAPAPVADASLPPAAQDVPAVAPPPAEQPATTPFGQPAAPAANAPAADVAVPPAAPASRAPAADPGARPPAPAAPEPRPQPPVAADAEAAFLDQTPPNLDGRAAGERVAGTYRNEGPNTSFGTSRGLRARERFPGNATAAERRGIFVLLNMMHLQNVYQRNNGRYGSFADTLPMRVPNPRSLQRNGYRFDLTVESDGYRIVGTPMAMGLRALVGDDSGFVRWADD
ncbi:MAG TPA: serine/threonine-protein kinase [Vicinamibacteria bacterium]